MKKLCIFIFLFVVRGRFWPDGGRSSLTITRRILLKFNAFKNDTTTPGGRRILVLNPKFNVQDFKKFLRE